jgi:tRNA nucleotidyltransferase/poly(A) polymerase
LKNEFEREAVLVWTDEILAVQEIVQELPEDIYIVGGAVRDAYRRAPIHDLDLATSGSGLKVARALANRLGGAFYPLDEERDVGRAIIRMNTPTLQGNLTIDVSRFRVGTLLDDLRDRDFTINAMAVDFKQDALNIVIDPTGGLDDLAAKILRPCSPEALTNDPIRAMRAVRYAISLGMRIKSESSQLIIAAAPGLANVSRERVRDELFKILSLGKPRTALILADLLGVMRAAVPDASPLSAEQKTLMQRTAEQVYQFALAASPNRTDETAARFGLGMFVIALDRFRAPLHAHFSHLWPNDRVHRALMILMVMLGHLSSELVEENAMDLRLSRAEIDRWLGALAGMGLVAGVAKDDVLGAHRFWKATGASGVDAIILHLSRVLCNQDIDLDQDNWLIELERAQWLFHAYFEAYDRIVEPPVLVTGADLMAALKLKQGKIIGELLSAIQEAQVTGEVASPEDALTFARRALGDA